MEMQIFNHLHCLLPAKNNNSGMEWDLAAMELE